MKNAEITKSFFERIGQKSTNAILNSIAEHYQIIREQALTEVTGPSAEHLLDYMIEPKRTETYILMNIYGICPNQP